MQWVDLFLEQLQGAIEGHAPGSISWRFNSDENELRIAPGLVELVGGAQDGETVFPTYWLDISQVIEVFDAPPQVHWNTLDNEICIEGLIAGEEAWIIFARDPFDDDDPRDILDPKGRVRRKK